MNPFKLLDIDASQPKSNSSVEITYNFQKFNIDFIKLLYKSRTIFNKSNELNSLRGEEKATAINNYFTDIIKKADSLLHIDEKNYLIFLSILSGQPVNISNENLFDLFKLSKYFDISNLSIFLKDFCCKVNQYNDVNKILKKGGYNFNISEEEEEEFNEFIDLGKMSDILIENFKIIFDDYSFNKNFPHSTLFKLLQKCTNKDKIPARELFQMISRTLEKDLHFLPYIDITKLYDYEKEDLFKSIFNIEKKLQPPPANEENQKTIESPKLTQTQTQNNIKQSNSISSNEVGKNTNPVDFSSLTITQTYPPKKNSLITNNDNVIQNISTSQNTNNDNQDDNDQDISTSQKLDLKKDNNDNQDISMTQKPNTKKVNNAKQDISMTQKPNTKKINIDSQDISQTQKPKAKDDNLLDSTRHKDTQQDSSRPDKSPVNQSSQNDSSKFINSKSTTYHSQAKPDSHIQRTPSNQEYHPPTSPKNLQRIKVFNENKKIVKDGYYYFGIYKNFIGKDLDYSLKNTVLVSDRDNLIVPSVQSKIKYLTQRDKGLLYKKVEVTPESTFAAAIKCKTLSKKVCVLNFASATQPGGGVLNGRNAQEEVLSRQSTLYFSIAQMEGFYRHNAKEKDPFGTDYMIYSPNVIIIRDDNDKLINLPVKVSVISSVAVNYSEILEKYKGRDMRRDVYDVMLNRCRRILQLCIKEGNDIIVLGAFGCGVFQNSPEMISDIFKKIIIDEGYGEMFLKIVFAIKIKPDQTTELIDAFKNAFKPHHHTDSSSRPTKSGTGTGTGVTRSGTATGIPSSTSFLPSKGSH